MGKPNQRYVCRAYNGGWSMWNRKMKKWWLRFDTFPSALLDELNGERRPDKIVQLVKDKRNGFER